MPFVMDTASSWSFLVSAWVEDPKQWLRGRLCLVGVFVCSLCTVSAWLRICECTYMGECVCDLCVCEWKCDMSVLCIYVSVREYKCVSLNVWKYVCV